jgi:hypothetical protein
MAKQSQHYWLPESYHLRLTAFEAGYLTMLVYEHARPVPMTRRGPTGEPVRTDIREILLGKLAACANDPEPADETGRD